MATKNEMRDFALEVSKISETFNTSMFESILLYCKQKGMEPETAATLVDKTLKAKLTEEARTLNLIRYEKGLL